MSQISILPVVAVCVALFVGCASSTKYSVVELRDGQTAQATITAIHDSSVSFTFLDGSVQTIDRAEIAKLTLQKPTSSNIVLGGVVGGIAGVYLGRAVAPREHGRNAGEEFFAEIGNAFVEMLCMVLGGVAGVATGAVVAGALAQSSNTYAIMRLDEWLRFRNALRETSPELFINTGRLRATADIR